MAHGNEKHKERYFFLKIQSSFFRSLRMKKLKAMPNGHVSIVIYLEMMQLCVDNNFILVYEGIENCIEDELAIKLNEYSNDVKLTFNYLKALGLLEELDGGDVRLPETATLIGSISYSALVKKEQRLDKKTKCPTSVQPMSNYKDIDIEKDIELDKELEKEKEIIKGERNPDNELF